MKDHVARRRFLAGGAAALSVTAISGCVSNDPKDKDEPKDSKANNDTNAEDAKPGKEITIGFSAPAADHGWMGAISKHAKEQAGRYKDVKFNATEGTNDVNQQISQVRSLIDQKVHVLVILPYDGKALTTIAREAMAKGIPVVNVDRVFSSPLAYRSWIGGDNYGMGMNAGNYIAAQMKKEKKDNPVIVEIAGIDNLPLTQDRSRGFKEALAGHGMKVAARQSADFTPAKGREVASSVLQSRKKIDALWNHDDDQGVGVEAAIKQAKREQEFLMVGGAGSKHAMDAIKSGTGPLRATVLYPPTMSADGIVLGRKIAQSRSLGHLVDHEVPASITLFSAVVNKDNVDDYLDVGFS
jgi:ribose transport system substrate-binding protein